MSYYVGSTPADSAGDLSIRYFYALRRDDAGMLYFAKVDSLQDDDTIVVNNPGLNENDFTEFEYGVDFFDGRLAEDHSRPYSNLEWDQYRWSARNIFYYINDNGEFVVRINKGYNYPADAQV
jgi:hypothetical protein